MHVPRRCEQLCPAVKIIWQVHLNKHRYSTIYQLLNHSWAYLQVWLYQNQSIHRPKVPAGLLGSSDGKSMDVNTASTTKSTAWWWPLTLPSNIVLRFSTTLLYSYCWTSGHLILPMNNRRNPVKSLTRINDREQTSQSKRKSYFSGSMDHVKPSRVKYFVACWHYLHSFMHVIHIN